jgi:peptide/nickel transport system substrate-binding protein
MLANELNEVTPLPQHAWDKGGGPQQVWKNLNSAAKNISRYATDPL